MLECRSSPSGQFVPGACKFGEIYAAPELELRQLWATRPLQSFTNTMPHGLHHEGIGSGRHVGLEWGEIEKLRNTIGSLLVGSYNPCIVPTSSKSPRRGRLENAFKSVRTSIVERDGNRCVKCGSSLSLEVHHIEGYRHNEPELLITLCYLCHGVAPMGKEQFNRWLQSGERGIDVFQQRMTKNGFKDVTPGLIIGFCSTLMEFGFELRKSQLRNAREYTRSQTGHCEGIRPYGAFPGEAEVLELILQKRNRGMLADDIASDLNTNGNLSRKGKSWRASTIRKILARIKKAKHPRLF